MATFFSGWLGYGSAVQGGVLVEPSDPAYARRQYILGDIDSGIVSDVGSGTVGPAGATWGTICFVAVFDAQAGGNLLLWLPLQAPLVVGVGGTITSSGGANSFFFPDLQMSRRTVVVWPVGAPVARTLDGRVLTAGVALQAVGGQLTAQTAAFGTNVTMASLPAAQPSSGTGQLWNNGGIISVS